MRSCSQIGNAWLAMCMRSTSPMPQATTCPAASCRRRVRHLTGRRHRSVLADMARDSHLLLDRLLTVMEAPRRRQRPRPCQPASARGTGDSSKGGSSQPRRRPRWRGKRSGRSQSRGTPRCCFPSKGTRCTAAIRGCRWHGGRPCGGVCCAAWPGREARTRAAFPSGSCCTADAD